MFFLHIGLAVSLWIPATTTAGILTRQGNCANLNLTAENWVSLDTDVLLVSWRNNTPNPVPGTLAREVGYSPDFQCGIDQFSSCTSPSCLEIQSNPTQTWAYYVLSSTSHLNTLFNEIYASEAGYSISTRLTHMQTGVTAGQVNFLGLVGIVSEDFFPWKEPVFSPISFIIWMGAIIATAASFGTLGPEEVVITTAAAGAFVTAAGQQVVESLSPNLPPQEGIAQLGAFATQMSNMTLSTIENWANTVFGGQPDGLGKTFVDYLAGGLFMHPTYPSNQEINRFFTQQLLARIINMGWRTSHSKVFIMFANTSNPDDTNGPGQAKWYSERDGGVYYLYNYHETGHLKGRLDAPLAFDKLNSSSYNINPSDIVKSAAGAWVYAGYNYTDQDVMDRIEASVHSNGTLTPFQDGVGWEGIWTIPVCDIGNHVEWNTQWGDKKGFGRLPCCCGVNCQDTAAFVKNAGWQGFKTLKHGCKRQLKGSDIEFSSVNYGAGLSLKHGWNDWSMSHKLGAGMGLLLADLFLIHLA